MLENSVRYSESWVDAVFVFYTSEVADELALVHLPLVS